MYSGAARGFPAHEELHDQSLSEARPPDTGGNPSENPGERRTQTLLPAPDLDESLKEDQSQQPESELPKRNLLALGKAKQTSHRIVWYQLMLFPDGGGVRGY